MIKNPFILFVCLFSLLACSTKKTEEKKTDEALAKNTEELCPFAISEAILYDSSTIVTMGRGKIENGKWQATKTIFGYASNYTPMNPEQMQRLIQTITQIKDPSIYLDVDGNKMTKHEVFMFANGCDSIAEMDEQGNVTKVVFLCDSISRYNQIKKVIFYESWFIKPENGAIEKQVLGYTLCEKVENADLPNEQRYQTIFHVFNDEEALNKARKYASIKTM
jgi:hypothetical protein